MEDHLTGFIQLKFKLRPFDVLREATAVLKSFWLLTFVPFKSFPQLVLPINVLKLLNEFTNRRAALTPSR